VIVLPEQRNAPAAYGARQAEIAAQVSGVSGIDGVSDADPLRLHSHANQI